LVGMSDSVIHPSRGTVRICHAECDARNEVSIFVALALDLTEPRRSLPIIAAQRD
jgi:hypothetical protein